jgi:hypothetical protein
MSDHEFVPRTEFEAFKTAILVKHEEFKGEILALKVEHERIFRSLDNGSTRMDALLEKLTKIEKDLGAYKANKNTLLVLTAVCSALITAIVALVLHG